MFFFSWPSQGCELSSQPKRGISTSKENDSTTTLKAIILKFSGNVPVLYITTLMKRSNERTQFDLLQIIRKSSKKYKLK